MLHQMLMLLLQGLVLRVLHLPLHKVYQPLQQLMQQQCTKVMLAGSLMNRAACSTLNMQVSNLINMVVMTMTKNPVRQPRLASSLTAALFLASPAVILGLYSNTAASRKA